MNTLFRNNMVFISSLILFLLQLQFSSLVLGEMLHPSDNASVSDDVLSRRWPNGVIPYTVVVDSTTTHTEADFDTNRQWEALTHGAVRFVKRTTENPYIEVNIGADNSTKVLRGIREGNGTLLTGKRKIWIRPTSSYNINHELGHVLGMWHQQRHPDSEQCVTQHNETPSQLHASKFIGQYSSDSIMHYRRGSSDFTSWLVDPTDPTICHEMLWTDPPSDFDVNYVLKMYGVNGEYLNHTDWCSGRGRKRVYMGDFNGDGLDDLLCHTRESVVDAGGYRFIDYAESNSTNVFGSGDWETTSNRFCKLAHRNLYIGDFNGDDRDDLLCHDNKDGRRFIDYANSSGHLNGTNSRPDSYCAGSGKTIYVGDYDGDGKDDMLCHTKSLGGVSIDFAIDGFNGEDWNSGSDVWCKKSSRSIIVGDFNSDGRDDMICHDINDGHRWIDYANSNGHFNGSEWNSKKPFCRGSNRTVYAADVDGNGRDDLICHNRKIGSIAVDFASSSTRNEGSKLWKANTFREISFCNAQDAHLLIGRLPKNSASTQPDSLFCHNRATGHQAARYDFD